ncbi:MAG: alpha/beta hydrolase [Panacibacter sp.]
MKNKLIKFIGYALLLSFAAFLLLIFLPRHYNIPELQKRPGTQYLNLSTGSRIGYTLVAAKGIKKPYPVIYLHGGPGGAISDRVIQSLSPLADDGYDVYLYDQIGGGQSGRLETINEYTPERHVRDLEEIINETGAEKVILIGQSWGSILAVLFAADHAEQIEKIVFTSPGPVYPVRQELASIKAPDSFHLRAPYFSNAQGNEKANTIRSEAMTFCATHFGKKLAGDKEADAFADYVSYEVNKSTVCDTSKILPLAEGSGFYAGIVTFNNLLDVEDPRPKIKHCAIAVLVMKGTCDNQKWGYTHEYIDLFPNHQLVIIPGAGHFISLEQPELYLQTIRNFINK